MFQFVKLPMNFTSFDFDVFDVFDHDESDRLTMCQRMSHGMSGTGSGCQGAAPDQMGAGLAGTGPGC